MTMAPRVARYLADRSIPHSIVPHEPTATASQAAHASHISGNKIAKGVVLRDGDGFMLAVVPASHHVSLDMLAVWLGRPFEIATERDASGLFPDCDVGAIPPIGQAYGVDVLLHEELAELPEVCFEGGDHESLVRVSGKDFARMMDTARLGRFSLHD